MIVCYAPVISNPDKHVKRFLLHQCLNFQKFLFLWTDQIKFESESLLTNICVLDSPERKYFDCARYQTVPQYSLKKTVISILLSTMTIPRKYLINYSNTLYYHCVSRCVRQGYLLDRRCTDVDKTHYRQQWIEDRLMHLAEAFAIDVYAFSIMDNHTHLVLGANIKLSQDMSDLEVLSRWKKIGRIPPYCEAYLLYRCIPQSPISKLLDEKIAEYRKRLSCISWFMKYFNEYIARRANREEEKTGHFWESRFFSQALLDSDALLNCMAYVDLNPVRSGKYTKLIDSKYTSIKKRLEDFQTNGEQRASMALTSVSLPEQYTKLPFNMTLTTYFTYLGAAANRYQRENRVLPAEASFLITSYEKSPIFNFEEIYGNFAGKQSLIGKVKKKIQKNIVLH